MSDHTNDASNLNNTTKVDNASNVDNNTNDASNLDNTSNVDNNTAGDHQGARNVVPLNDAGAVFDALAQEIRGSAVGWPPGAVTKLASALERRYGDLIGGPAAVQRLVRLAQEPSAA